MNRPKVAIHINMGQSGWWADERAGEKEMYRRLTNYLSSSTSHAGQANIGLLEAGAKRQSWQQPQHGGGWWRRNRARLLSSSCSQYIFFRSCLSGFGWEGNNTKIKAKSDASITLTSRHVKFTTPNLVVCHLKFGILLFVFRYKGIWYIQTFIIL